MVKIQIILLCLAAFSQATVEVPQTLFSNNYSGLKEYIQGFVDGYTNEDVALPANCLSASAQSQRLCGLHRHEWFYR